MGINVLQVNLGILFGGAVLAELLFLTGRNILVEATLVETWATAAIECGAVTDLVEGRGCSESKGVGPLYDLTGLALITGRHWALVHRLASG